MKKSILVIAGCLVAGAAFGMYRYAELSADYDAVSAQLAFARQQLADMEKQRSDPWQMAQNSPDPDDAPAKSPAAANVPPAGPPANSMPGSNPERDARLRDRTQNRARQEAMMRSGGVLRELRLQPEQTREFMELLAKHQMQNEELFRSARRNDPGTEAAARDLRERQKVELMTVLGQEYQKYEFYNEHRREYRQVEQWEREISSRSSALTSGQKQQMVTAMNEERSKGSPEQYSQRVNQRLQTVMTAPQYAEYQELNKCMNRYPGLMAGGGGPGRRQAQ